MLDRELQQALAFYQPPPQSWFNEMGEKTRAAGEWLWETLQGDFNEHQTTGQIVTGTVISMIPLVDQLCDARDLIANCKKIQQDESNIGSWVGLGLTLIGCFPTLGSLTKGSLKVVFLALRKSHFNRLNEAGNYSRLLNVAVAQFNRYLDMPAVRNSLRTLKIYNPYHYLAGKLDELKALLTASSLTAVMDKLIQMVRKLCNTITDWGPLSLHRPVAELWNGLMAVRNRADAMLAKALKPLSDWLDRLANRLRVEGDNAFRAHVGVNTHIYGAKRANEEIEFFKREKPDWVDVGIKTEKFAALTELKDKQIEKINQGWPDIRNIPGRKLPTNGAFITFDSTMKASTVESGEILYRIVDPASSDNSICWMRKAEFDRLTSKGDWRRHFAVWKKWNENGEFVTYTVPPGQPLKVWEGRAATQVNREAPEYSLEGGWSQIVLNPSDLKKEYTGPRKKTGWGYGDAANDPAYPYLGLPKLETKHSWYETKEN